MRWSAAVTSSAVAIVTALLAASTADAATLVIGPQVGGVYRSATRPADSTNVPITWPGGVSAASPVDGTVVSWSVGTARGVYRLRIVRQIMPGIFRNVGNSDPASAPEQSFPPPSINPAVSIPIEAGDFIGLDARAGDRVITTSSAGSSSVTFTPTLADGGTSAPTATTSDAEVLTASVRYCQVPSLRGKSLKKAKKLLTAADCKVGKVKKADGTSGGKAKVLRQSPVAGTQVSDTAPIRLTLG